MNNSITEWSWDKPNREGLYLACRGDVETENNIYMVKAVIDSDGVLVDINSSTTECILEYWANDFKFARLCVGSEASE